MAALVVIVAGFCAGLSALWPVEYASTGVATPHPFDLGGLAVAAPVWDAVAHPAYAAFQLLWVVAVVARWRSADRLVRIQLTWVALAAALSVVSLRGGLLVWGTPRLGLLTAALVPVAAGWAIVHGQHLAAYSALTWLSRTGPAPLPTDLARAIAEALSAPRVVVWTGSEVAGTWPPDLPLPSPLTASPAAGSSTDAPPRATGQPSLTASRATGPPDPEPPSEAPDLLVRPIVHGGVTLGAIGIDRPDPLSPAEKRLLDDLTAQAVLVLQHAALARDAARLPPPADLTRLTPRERQVLDLMARGLTNAAICQELHLSIKTVEPLISSIFTKLDLDQNPANNRRVLAVRAYLHP